MQQLATQGEPISKIGAIRDFFQEGGRKVEMGEIKALTQQDRDELAPACAAALGRPLAVS